MISIWEKLSLLKKDVVIIGGGITGLSAAAHLKENYPERSVTIIEKGLLPTGASTKNAGFACFGSLSEIIDDLFTMSEEEVVNLVSLRLNGLSLLKNRLGEKSIDYQQNGGYELINRNDAHYLEKIDYINQILAPVFGTDCFRVCDEKISKFGFDSNYVSNLVYTPFEGQIDTGKMISELQNYCRNKGVEFLTGTEIVDLNEKGDEVLLTTNNQIKLSASKVLIATNGFISQLLPEMQVSPGRGLVLSTKPVKGLKLKGTFHMDKGYYYFRNFGDRLIFGGGRNLDFESEVSTNHEVNQIILEKLKELLRQVILPSHSYEIDLIWTGIMGFGHNKNTTIRQYSANISMAVGLGGMGVAIGSIVGQKLAKMALESNK